MSLDKDGLPLKETPRIKETCTDFRGFDNKTPCRYIKIFKRDGQFRTHDE